MRNGIRLRTLLTAVVLSLTATGQTKMTQMRSRATEPGVLYSNGRMEFQYAGKPVVIDGAMVPFPEKECGTRCEDLTGSLRKDCRGKCSMFEPEALAFNPAKPALIFGIFTDFSQNKPMVLMEADLQTGGYRHLIAFYTAGLTDAVFSPDGRYLAFANWVHDGGCFNSSRVGVIDLEDHTGITVAEFGADSFANGSMPKQVRRFSALRWRSATTLEGIESTFSTARCTNPIRQLTRSVDISTLDLHPPTGIE